MLAPVSRYRYTKTYMYGSIAFVAGFAAVMALLVHFAPLHVMDANVANLTSPKTAEQKDSATKNAASEGTATAETPTNSPVKALNMATTPTIPTASSTGTSSGDTPATDTGNAPADPTTPAEPTDPTDPTDPTEPEQPADPTDPITDILDQVLPLSINVSL